MSIRSTILLTTFFLMAFSSTPAQDLPIIPQPRQVTWSKDLLVLDKDIRISSCSAYPEIPGILQEGLKDLLGHGPAITDFNTSTQGGIRFRAVYHMIHIIRLELTSALCFLVEAISATLIFVV